ncbi:MAG: FliM/FliN family flagellar motor switch protein [Dethiobacter sp.]|jgi:flagellar motor switch protein FliN|nr:FliM/FliN family flagellar motor switch protein [Dethiobacter sp.]
MDQRLKESEAAAQKVIRDFDPDDDLNGGSYPDTPVVRKVEFQPLPAPVSALSAKEPSPRFFGIPLSLSAELGKIAVPVSELISLKQGSTLKLQRVADERVLILLNETPFAHGEVVVINERFGIRVTSLLGEGTSFSAGPNRGERD